MLSQKAEGMPFVRLCYRKNLNSKGFHCRSLSKSRTRLRLGSLNRATGCQGQDFPGSPDRALAFSLSYRTYVPYAQAQECRETLAKWATLSMAIGDGKEVAGVVSVDG